MQTIINFAAIGIWAIVLPMLLFVIIIKILDKIVGEKPR